MDAAYVLFGLLKAASRQTLVSAVRQANALGTFKVAYLVNLLEPSQAAAHPVYPQDAKLLDIHYERRDLARYDDLI